MTDSKTNLHDILLDDLGIVADRLDEEELEAHFLDDDVHDELAPLDRGIGRVEDGHLAVARLQPLAGVVERVHGALGPDGHGLHVVGTKEVVALVGRGRVSPVLAEIVDLRADADPVQVAAELLRDVGLAAGRQAHHRYHVRLVHEVGSFAWNREGIINIEMRKKLFET